MVINVQIPVLGDSVSEAVLLKWHKSDGDVVKVDEPLCELETDKANLDLPSNGAGLFKRTVPEGTKVRIGQTVATIDTDVKGAAKPAAKPAKAAVAETGRTAATVAPPASTASSTSSKEELSPAVRRMVEENQLDPSTIAASGPGGRITKEDVVKHLDGQAAKSAAPSAGSNNNGTKTTDTDFAAAVPVMETAAPHSDGDGTRRVAMSKIRKKIGERLVAAQHTAAILTTFNEVDLQKIIELRTKYKERFEKTHQVGLGFMSFFAKAATLALKEFERVNAQIEGDEIIYHDYVHLGIAVSTDRGLAVPVLRHVEKMSFAKIESEIKRLAAATRDGKLSLQELSGGTFTITNGGVFGSLLSTPIINPPQSGILGMHAIQKRAVVVDDKIEIRPMMYIALSYDHRLVDGRESVSFLVRLKELLEDPARLLLEI